MTPSSPNTIAGGARSWPRPASMLSWLITALTAQGRWPGQSQWALSGPDERLENGGARGPQISRREWQGGRDRRLGRRIARCLSRGDWDEGRRPARCGGGALGSLRFGNTDQGVFSLHRLIRRNVENYVGSSSTEDLRKASPITYVDATVSPPLYVVASDDEIHAATTDSRTCIRKLEEMGATNFRQ